MNWEIIKIKKQKVTRQGILKWKPMKFSLPPSSDKTDLGFHKDFLLASKAQRFVLQDNTSSTEGNVEATALA